MSNLYQSSKKKLGDILSDKNQVPIFQRNFSWDLSQVETFWQDLVSFSEKYPDTNINQQEYFIGPVVLVTTAGSKNIILDGQQRIATSTILVSVIVHYLNQIDTTAAQSYQNSYVAGFDHYEGVLLHHLTMNQYDRDFFRREIQEMRSSDQYQEPEPTIDSHRLIRKARNYFLQQVGIKQTGFGADTQAFKRWLIRIAHVLTEHLSVVYVTSDNEDNASLVFETLNDRGIGLSAPDLLRNLLLSRATEDQRDEIVENWRDVIGLEGKASVEDYLRHFWVSKQGDVKTRSLYREIKNKVVAENIDPATFSRELQIEARIYEDIVNANNDDTEVQGYLLALQSLGARSALPLVLVVMVSGNISQQRKTLHNIVSLFVRFSTIGGLENNRIESFLFTKANALRNDGDFALLNNDLSSFGPNDATFINDFSSVKVKKSSVAKYLLYKIQLQKVPGTGETVVDYPKLNLEHIYPKASRSRWPEHDEYIDRLGNLTLLLTRINRGLSNAPFAEKVATYATSELTITSELVEHNEWSTDKIFERQTTYAQLAPLIWNFI